MSGGLAFEGLNNASATPNNLLIILNDNNMAIDRSVGGMKQYLLNLQMSEGYNRIRYKNITNVPSMGYPERRTPEKPDNDLTTA